jgi:hypothetical protein
MPEESGSRSRPSSGTRAGARRLRRGAAAAAGERDHRPGGEREDADRRTAVRRHEGDSSAASTCSRRRTSTRRSSWPPGFRRRGWEARSRCGRWWSSSAARAGLPRGVGPRPRQPDRLPRRLRSRRGGRPGGVRDCRRALAAVGRASQSGRVADDDGAQRAIDRLRRDRTLTAKTRLLEPPEAVENEVAERWRSRPSRTSGWS